MRRIWEQNKYLFLVFLLVGSLVVAWSETTSIKEAYAKNSTAGDIEGYNFSSVTQAAALYMNWASSDMVFDLCPTAKRFSFKVPTSGADSRYMDMGSLLGYFSPDMVDQLPLFQSSLADQNSNLTTSYSYSALARLKANPTAASSTQKLKKSGVMGSGSFLYPYAAYGRALSLLGFDSTTVSNQDAGLRVIVGYAYLISFMASMSLNNFFGYILALLKAASPFSLLIGALNAGASSAKGINTADSTFMSYATNTSGTAVAPAMGTNYTGVSLTNFSTIPGLNGMDVSAASTSIESGVGTIMSEVSGWLAQAREFGWVILIVNLAVIIFCTMMIRKYRTGEGFMAKFKTFAIRFVFWSIGIPLLCVTYDNVLTEVGKILKGTSNSNVEILASTFLDFETWVNYDSLALKATGTTIKVTFDDVGNILLDDGTQANCRNLCYEINETTEAFFPKGSSAVTQIVGSGTGVDAFTSFDEGAFSRMNSTTTDQSQIMEFSIEILRRYISGKTVKPSDYASTIKSSYLTMNGDAGLSAFIRDYSDPKNYDYGMYTLISSSDVTHDNKYSFIKGGDDLKELFARIYGNGQNPASFTTKGNRGGVDGDYMVINSSNVDNRIELPIFSTSASATGSTGVYTGNGYTYSNLFGGALKSSMDAKVNTDSIEYIGGSSSWQPMGMSPLATFNYLSTDFGDQSMVVYATSTGAQTDAAKMEHYSVNLVGTGVMQIIYALSGLMLMSCMSIIGYGYGLSLLIHNFRALFKVIPSAITALMGSIKGIASVIVLFISMVAEVLVTVVLYSLASTLMLAMFKIVEKPVAILMKNTLGSGTHTLHLLPLVGILSIVLIFYLTTQMLKWRHAIVMAMSDVGTSIINKFMSTQVSTPDLGKGSSLGQKAMNAASIGGSLALAGARMGAGNPLSAMAEKFGVNTAPNADAGSVGEKPDGTAGNGQDPINKGTGLDENGRAITDKDGNPISMTQADIDNFQDTTGINMNDVMDTAIAEYGDTDESSIQSAIQDIGGTEAVEAYNQAFGDNNTDFNNAVHSRAEGARESSGQRSIVNANTKMTNDIHGGGTNISTAANMAAFQNNKNAMIDQSVGGNSNGYVGGNEVRVFSGATGAMTAEDMRGAINAVSVQAGGQEYAMGSVPADAVMAMMDSNGDGNVTAAEKQVFQMQTGFTQESFDQLTGGNNTTQAITFENHFVEGGGDAQFRQNPVDIQVSIDNLNAGIQDGVAAGADASGNGQGSGGQQ